MFVRSWTVNNPSCFQVLQKAGWFVLFAVLLMILSRFFLALLSFFMLSNNHCQTRSKQRDIQFEWLTISIQNNRLLLSGRHLLTIRFVELPSPSPFPTAPITFLHIEWSVLSCQTSRDKACFYADMHQVWNKGFVFPFYFQCIFNFNNYD